MTVPVPTQVVMADVLRDGGSYLLVIDVEEGGQRTLLLPVSIDSSMRAVGYGPPKLLLGDLSTSRDLDWAEARTLVERVVSLKPNFSSEVNLELLKELLAIIEREGRVGNAA